MTLTAPPPKPPSYAEVDDFQEELAVACGVVNAGSAQIVAMVAAALESGLWAQAGIMSAQHYVSWQCGLGPARAHQVVAIARRASELPVAMATFTEGRLSLDQMATICRYCPAAKDAEVTEFAIQATVPQLRRTLSGYGFDAEAKPPKEPEARKVSFGTNERGTWTMNAELPLDEGARVEASMGALRDELFHEAGTTEEKREVSWADALLEMSDRATGASKRRFRDRHRVYLHVDVADPVGFTGHFHVGSPLANWARRYLCCDATITPILEKLGLPLSFGLKVHTVPERLRIVVENRDRGCRVPGCSRDHLLHVHHIVHWEDKGPTESWNLVCLCQFHHRLHHRGLLGITGNPNDPNGLIFTDERGRTIASAGSPAPPGAPPPQAATTAGYPWQPYTHGTGERLQSKWVDFGPPYLN